MLPWPEPKALLIAKRYAREIENVFEIERDVDRLEGGLGDESGPKCFAIERVKSVPKRSITIFFREAVRVDQW